MKILVVLGTRPEAIKMAPVIRALMREPDVIVATCVTGQHRDMVAPVLDAFDIVPEWDLDAMAPGCTLNALMSRIIGSIDPVFETFRPDRILVHGDTTSAIAGALAAFHRQVPVAHVEAGLRTHDLSQPWPEEMNRRVIDAFADLLFAPTAAARRNLLSEGIASERILVTGNTVIDALTITRAKLRQEVTFEHDLLQRFPFCGAGRPLLLVTGHRRENLGTGLEAICRALATLAARDDIHIVYPVHLNPNVRAPVMRLLGDLARVSLIEPLGYADFVWLMDRAHVILTDSGGVQEEAASIGTPVLVMREVTERGEAVASGAARLVGTDQAGIVAAVSRLFMDADAYRAASRVETAFGDGRASDRIVGALLGRAFDEFTGAKA